jgi:pyruvyltransferase
MGILRDIKVHSLYLKQRVEAPIYRALSPQHLAIVHYVIRNWGDALNPVFVRRLTGLRVRSIDIEARQKDALPGPYDSRTVYMVIGSIVHHADCQTVIWGAGLMSSDLRPRQPPKKIRAVRGPLTAKALRDNGFECPDIFGDPALLLPRYFPNVTPKRYRLGVIPHVNDASFELPEQVWRSNDVLVINLRRGILRVLQQIQSCEHIVSSSLHGLIAADAYGIPSRRLILGGRLAGGDFKFHDYYASIGNQPERPLRMLASTTVQELVEACSPRDLEIDLDQLMSVCPLPCR